MNAIFTTDYDTILQKIGQVDPIQYGKNRNYINGAKTPYSLMLTETDTWQGENIYFKEHPLNIGYKGNQEPRDWITDNVTEYYPSFFGYWEKVE